MFQHYALSSYAFTCALLNYHVIRLSFRQALLLAKGHPKDVRAGLPCLSFRDGGFHVVRPVVQISLTRLPRSSLLILRTKTKYINIEPTLQTKDLYEHVA